MSVFDVYERNKSIGVRPRRGPDAIPEHGNIELDNRIQVQVPDLIPRILSVLGCQQSCAMHCTYRVQTASVAAPPEGHHMNSSSTERKQTSCGPSSHDVSS